MNAATLTPRVAITCLASYNANRLIYEWVDASDGIEALNEARDNVKARAIAAAKEAGEYPVYFGDPEEFFFSDIEGFGDAIGEYEDWEHTVALAKAIEEHGDAFMALLSISGRDDLPHDVDGMVEAFQDKHIGTHESFREFCQEWVSQGGWAGLEPGSDQLESASQYFDWDMIERELEVTYTEAEYEGQSFIFNTSC